ncbi:zinc metalloprotease [Nocardioides sp. AX2bis]|uniref:zinc metalloprotease n=1 Tax=Nocardioides sp. AX2bis TaxID=2653157 RepID=UPI0012F015B4|nr:zinc metalloprotease [Nocardioides sp. AX2bis]VXB75504.1 Zinc metalloprotease [Nocardioides sp. AX2bis]
MRLTSSLRPLAAVALATAALIATGPAATAAPAPSPSPEPSSAVASSTETGCRAGGHQQGPGRETSADASAGPAARTSRATQGPDHREVTPAEQRAIEARTDLLLAQRAPGAAAARDVPTYVHVMAGEDGEGDVGRDAVRRQVRVLDRTYAGSGFDFDLSGIDRTYDDRYHQDRLSEEYRAETHRGGARALNIWLVDFEYLGVATFPWDQADRPRIDGVRVNVGSLPGGDLERFDQGRTATHEVGHWLGLYHTFQGGCTRRNDLVRDTPAQRSESSGCPVGRDSCRLPGNDPVHNYMDYSDDACYERFSDGQVARMRSAFAAYRA